MSPTPLFVYAKLEGPGAGSGQGEGESWGRRAGWGRRAIRVGGAARSPGGYWKWREGPEPRERDLQRYVSLFSGVCWGGGGAPERSRGRKMHITNPVGREGP